MTLALMGNTLLRTAITRNLVSFPAQIRPFMRRSSGDLQERIVQLYFVRGWSVRSICDRYGLSKAMAHKMIGEWRIRAVESGFIQEIETGSLAALVQETEIRETEVQGIRVEASLDGGSPTVSAYVGVPMTSPGAVISGANIDPAEFNYTSAAQAPMPPMENPGALTAGSAA
jgi:transposase-like protein